MPERRRVVRESEGDRMIDRAVRMVSPPPERAAESEEDYVPPRSKVQASDDLLEAIETGAAIADITVAVLKFVGLW